MNAAEKRTTRVGICFADAETFWWAADDVKSEACPGCSLEDEDYAANHRFYVSEDELRRKDEALARIAQEPSVNVDASFALRACVTIARAALAGELPPEPEPRT